MPIKYPQLRFTRLDATQIATLVARGAWRDTQDNMDIMDYMQYVVIAMEALMAPITIATAIYTCVRARWCKRPMGSDLDIGEVPIENMPLRALNRRLNYDRNRALLQMPRN